MVLGELFDKKLIYILKKVGAINHIRIIFFNFNALRLNSKGYTRFHLKLSNSTIARRLYYFEKICFSIAAPIHMDLWAI